MVKAGKRTTKEIQKFLDASYEDNPPETIGDWVLDKSISNKTGKVYYNPKTGEAIVAHRGTKGARDWINNVAYATGTYKYTTRYKRGEKLQNKAETKYGKPNISTIGHSQGAVLARELGNDTKEVINVNPAYKGEIPADNEYNIRSSTDIVSGLYPLMSRDNHDITIPSQSPTDILGEHSYNIIERLGDREIGVGAGIKSHHYNIMSCGGKRYNNLGFSVDDIDWIHGGIRCGGKNPFKGVSKSFKKVGKSIDKGISKTQYTLAKANPLHYKPVQDVGIKLGDVTNNYLLPAVVEAGKPLYTATAMGASTMLTGNPLLGKVASDALWNEMVAKQGNDPRERQKSKELGELSGIAGKTGSKFLAVGKGRAVSGRTLIITRLRAFQAQIEGLDDRFNEWTTNPNDFTLEDYNELYRLERECINLRRQLQLLRNDINKYFETLRINVEEDNPLIIFINELESYLAELLEEMMEFYPEPDEEPEETKEEDVDNLIESKEEDVEPPLKKQKKGGMRRWIDSNREERERLITGFVTTARNLLTLTRMKVLSGVYSREVGVRKLDDLIDFLEQAENELQLNGNPNNQIRLEIGRINFQKNQLPFVEEGAGRKEKKKIDFEDVKWGTFTRMFQEFKREHPRAKPKDLDSFADYVIKNKKKFSDLTLKKAHFYRNIIKKGGSKGQDDADAELNEIFDAMDIDGDEVEERTRPSAPAPEITETGEKRKVDEVEEEEEKEPRKKVKGKVKGKRQYKGGASPEQIGQAASMRTWIRNPVAAEELNYIAHSADFNANKKEGKFNIKTGKVQGKNQFVDLYRRFDPRAEDIIQRLDAEYHHEVFKHLGHLESLGAYPSAPPVLMRGVSAPLPAQAPPPLPYTAHSSSKDQPQSLGALMTAPQLSKKAYIMKEDEPTKYVPPQMRRGRGRPKKGGANPPVSSPVPSPPAVSPIIPLVEEIIQRLEILNGEIQNEGESITATRRNILRARAELLMGEAANLVRRHQEEIPVDLLERLRDEFVVLHTLVNQFLRI